MSVCAGTCIAAMHFLEQKAAPPGAVMTFGNDNRLRLQCLVHDTQGLGLFGGHEVVTVGVVGDGLERLAGRPTS